MIIVIVGRNVTPSQRDFYDQLHSGDFFDETVTFWGF